MSKVDVVATQKTSILVGQDAALQAGLEAVYDQAAAEQRASDGTLSQADLDAAVAAAVAPLNAQIQTDALNLAAAQATATANLAAVQQALTDMTAKEQLEEQAVMSLQNSIGAVQTALDAIRALVFPAPPAPVPTP